MPVVEEPEQPTQQEQHRAVSTASTGDSDSLVRDDAAIIKAGLAAVAEWEAENGPFTEEEIAWADAVLDRAERHYENLKNR